MTRSNSTEALREEIKRELDKRLPLPYGVHPELIDALTDGVMVVLARAEAQDLVSQAFQIRVNRPEP